MSSVSVAIPVKDGALFLGPLLAALADEAPDEVLVIDSGSRDDSVAIAREAGATVVEIEPESFGHGRTRNLAFERAGGDLVCFLTQDAEPVPGWLAAHREAFTLADRVGASYGPHLPRPGTSPMIARELEDFFAGMSPDGGPVVHRAGDNSFLSNVNACYARDCWREIRFEDVAYSEDQAFGAAMLAAGWQKVYHPRAAVKHAHDYGPIEFARRYFDEYRGLKLTVGHVEPARPAASARAVRAAVSADRRWMRSRGLPASSRARWTARALVHHGSRKAAAVLATRAGELPAPLTRRLSLEGRAGDDAPAPPPRPAEPRYLDVLRVIRDGPTPLVDAVPGMAERDSLHLAFVIPPFTRGSGGHSSIFELLARLEGAGHTCTIWVHDAGRKRPVERAAVLRHRVITWFQPVRAPVFVDFGEWHGADVVVATGWETAHPVAALPGCRARAYLVQDHEPEFFESSAERLWAEQTYSLGLFPISASHWLRDLLATRYGSDGAWFRLGVDHSVYAPRQVERAPDTVAFYARYSTPRRAVALGVLALEELHRRRPETRVVTFGNSSPIEAGFPTVDLGVTSPSALAEAYAGAAAGLCLSLTNYSLIPQEMMACGLPCVDLAGGSSEAMFGADGPVALAAADPIGLADVLESLMHDRERWTARSEAGIDHVATATWAAAAAQVEAGLRTALRRREAAPVT